MPYKSNLGVKTHFKERNYAKFKKVQYFQVFFIDNSRDYMADKLFTLKNYGTFPFKLVGV